MPDVRPDRRRTFGPVVLAGGAAGALVAVAASRPWVSAAGPGDGAPAGGGAFVMAGQAVGEMPLAAALSLVVLACWGVLLVTRRTVRRLVAALGLMGASGVAVTVVVGFLTLPDDVRTALAENGASDTAVEHTGWFWAAAVGALLSMVATAAAVRFAPAWPEMGRRYDAPGAAPEAAPDPQDASSLDLWKAMDEGRDPTT